MSASSSIATALLVLLGAMQAHAQPLSGVPASRYNHFTKGVNLYSWFNCFDGEGVACSSTNLPYVPIAVSDMANIASLGFNSVRLCVDPLWLLPDALGPAPPSVELVNLDNAIDNLISHNLGVDLVMMNEGYFANLMLTSPARVQQLVNLWQTLAQRYANRNPDMLMFEIMNEPPDSFSPSFWDGIERQAIQAIRPAAPQNTIIATSVGGSDPDNLISQTPILPDPNVIYVFHEYSPSIVTHQCSGQFMTLKGVPYPTYLGSLQTILAGITDPNVIQLTTDEFNENWYSGRFQRLMRTIAAWAKSNGVLVLMNELGINRPAGEGGLAPGCMNPTDADRGRYITDARTAAEANGIGWSFSDYAGPGWGVLSPPFTYTNQGIVVATGTPPDPVVLGGLGLGPLTLAPIAPPPFPFSGAEPVQYGPPLPYGGNTASAIIADVNGDGLPDLVVTVGAGNPNPVEFFLNDGAGGLAYTPTMVDSSAVTTSVDVIVAGQFDSSGRPGLFFAEEGAHAGTGGQSLLLLPSSNGTYQNATANLPQQIASTYSADAADIDGDGYDDLVLFNGPPVGGSFNNRLPLQILHNDGTGKFTISTTALPSSVTDLSGGGNLYYNGKFIIGRLPGAADLLILGASGSESQLLFNDGAGHFQPGPVLPPSGLNGPAGGQSVIVNDLNGDGYPDLIIASVTYPSQSYLQVLINNGDYTFRDETALRITQVSPSFGVIQGIYMAETNGGKNRLLMVTAYPQSPILKLDDGKGVFSDVGAPYSGGTTDEAWNGVLALLNSDGYADVVFGPGNPNSSPPVKVMWGLQDVQALGANPPSTTTAPSVSRLLNAASYAPLTSPGTWTTVFGSNFLPAGTPARTWTSSEIVNGHLPTQLDNVSVLVNGTPAYVYYISPGQIDIQIPDGTTRGYVPVEVETPQGDAYSTVNISDLSPALFTVGALNGSQLVAAVALDGTYIADPTVVPGSRGAMPGETIEIYGAGFGATTPASPAGMLVNPAPLSNAATVKIGSMSITPEFSGIVSPGLYQLNVQIPAGLSDGDYPILVQVAGMQTQPSVVIPVSGN
jgi:uncharacterized protein (TIGR03437 family)